MALVIGNGAYAYTPRPFNPIHDAEDVAALKRSNFDVIFGADVRQPEMQEAASNADVAVFYYSGHAMQFSGVNYLMPIDAKPDDEADLRRFARVTTSRPTCRTMSAPT